MSDLSKSGWEGDAFVTVDDRIFLAGDDLRKRLDSAAESFIECLDEVGKNSFMDVAVPILVAAEDVRANDPDTLEIARRSFLFAKLIGYFAMQPHPLRTFIGDVPGPDCEQPDNPMQTIVSASLLEWRDSRAFKTLINAHREKLDPIGTRADIVNLFAGFALLNMNNALYFGGDDAERMHAAGDEMAKASEEDWEKGLNDLLGEG